jgi:hypothetical protein
MLEVDAALLYRVVELRRALKFRGLVGKKKGKQEWRAF